MLPNPVVQAASKQRGLVTLQQLDTMGVSRNERRRALEAGDLVQVFAGVYRLGGFSELREMRWLAACLWYPDAVLSHRTRPPLRSESALS